MTIEHRDYQHDQVQKARQAIRNGARKVLLQAPTGSGKTVVYSIIQTNAINKGRRGIFVAHRREIIRQTSKKLHDFGIHNSILMAGFGFDHWSQVAVASVQTIQKRYLSKKAGEFLPSADLLTIDEAHRSVSRSYRDVIDHYSAEGAFTLGLTATPTRSDGLGLGHIYDEMVLGPSVRSLIDDGFLVQPTYYAPSLPDLSDLKRSGFDYSDKQLDRKMNHPKVIGDVVENWFRIDGTRQTIVFCPGVKSSMAVCKQFKAAGIRAEHIDAHTPHAERDQIIKRTMSGDNQVICNAMVLTEGVDIPPIGHVVLFRPTKSLVLYLQMAGRALRPYVWPNGDRKTDCIIQDHSGAILEHGRVETPIPWALNHKGRIQDVVREIRQKEPTELRCESCKFVFSGRMDCPSCGALYQLKPKETLTKDGILVRFDDKPAKERASMTYAEKRDFIQELNWIARQHNYKQGWVYHKALRKFGDNSLDADLGAAIGQGCREPRDATLRWVKSENIRHHKRRQA